ncbi:hypothetical protein [Hydrogenimonas cancrithermarum]|uniref:Uncharacterized protein n=1 Tax=Hydrogenimonas cancrithermarum TaxID=2993563 RepID=A0ABN6WXF4_9BACT|nr:hypothetical protein [Hydrogenimonas cancrithermarum]BDY13969.1 hypothetical protein HCR_22820 [Hydrogenimonas cancrithermarum]
MKSFLMNGYRIDHADQLSADDVNLIKEHIAFSKGEKAAGEENGEFEVTRTGS